MKFNLVSDHSSYLLTRTSKESKQKSSSVKTMLLRTRITWSLASFSCCETATRQSRWGGRWNLLPNSPAVWLAFTAVDICDSGWDKTSPVRSRLKIIRTISKQCSPQTLKVQSVYYVYWTATIVISMPMKMTKLWRGEAVRGIKEYKYASLFLGIFEKLQGKEYHFVQERKRKSLNTQ